MKNQTVGVYDKKERIEKLYKQYQEVDKKRLEAIQRYDKKLFQISLRIGMLEKFDMVD